MDRRRITNAEKDTVNGDFNKTSRQPSRPTPRPNLKNQTV